MKKKIILIVSVIFLLIIGPITFIVISDKTDNSYKIKLEKIDDNSPDRKLILYQNNKEVEFKKIEYLDGTILCKKNNPTIFFGDLDGIKKVIVTLKDDKKIKIKVIMEEE